MAAKQPASSPAGPYTILRIKRKRTDEPLEALVVEPSKRRKSKGGAGIFQFAETVEEEAWAYKQQELQSRITTLAGASDDGVKASQTPPASRGPIAPVPGRERRYTVIQQNPADAPVQRTSRLPQSPPKVISHKDLGAKASEFTVYDAVPTPSTPPEPADSEMAKFQDLLQEYLTVNDIEPEPMSTAASKSSIVTQWTDRSEDYVWDIFYHSTNKAPEWAPTGNVATLTGLPQSFGEFYDSGSDSEDEDEEDEDSNAEDFYRNDYPEEEDARDDSGDSDMFHEDSGDDLSDPEERFVPSEWPR